MPNSKTPREQTLLMSMKLWGRPFIGTNVHGESERFIPASQLAELEAAARKVIEARRPVGPNPATSTLSYLPDTQETRTLLNELASVLKAES